MNDQIFGLLDRDYTTYLSDASVETQDDDERLNFTIVFLNSINPCGMPQHRLRLKAGTVALLQRNLNTKKGLCNETKLAISSMRRNVIEAKSFHLLGKCAVLNDKLKRYVKGYEYTSTGKGACLKRVGTSDANLVGKLFFNFVQTKCFVLKPKKKCVRSSWWGTCEKHKVVKQAILRDNSAY
nr:unnamed protein product [Callosobruchus analis]